MSTEPLTMQDLELEQAELLPSRETLCCPCQPCQPCQPCIDVCVSVSICW